MRAGRPLSLLERLVFEDERPAHVTESEWSAWDRWVTFDAAVFAHGGSVPDAPDWLARMPGLTEEARAVMSTVLDLGGVLRGSAAEQVACRLGVIGPVSGDVPRGFLGRVRDALVELAEAGLVHVVSGGLVARRRS